MPKKKTEGDAPSPRSSNEFDRFEALTKRLVEVPKKELSRKLKAHERKRRLA